MRLTWYGHACFRLEGEVEGTAEGADGPTGPLAVVTDPYTPAKTGYAPIAEPADIVVTSSVTDDYHDRADLIPGDPLHVDALAAADTGGRTSARGLAIEAVEAAEAEHHPSGHPDRNAMYAFALDGLRVAHMGDVGNPLSARQVDFLRGTDVLLALAGGYPTIALADLGAVVAEVRPRLVVPMHFRTLVYRPRNIEWIAPFLELFGEEDVDFAGASTVEITRAGLPERTRAIVMDHLRRDPPPGGP